MATLIYSDTDGIEHEYQLDGEPVTIGRGVECAIRSHEPLVSRQHARIFAEAGQWWIEDLGSSNGVYIGAKRITREKLQLGRLVVAGSLILRLGPSSSKPFSDSTEALLLGWLIAARRARRDLEEERNALGARVAQLHREMAQRNDTQLDEPPEQRDSELCALQEQLDERTKQCDALQVELAALAKQAREREKDLSRERGAAAERVAGAKQSEALRIQLSESRDELATARLEVERLTEAVAKSQEALQIAEGRVAGLEQGLAAATARVDTAAASAKHHAEQLCDELRLKNAELAAKHEQLKGDHTELEQQHQALTVERDRLVRVREATISDASAGELETTIAELRFERDAADEQVKELQAQIAALHEQQGVVARDARSLTDERDRLNQECELLRSERDDVVADRDRIDSARSEVARAHERTEADLSDAKAEIEALRRRCDEAQQKLADEQAAHSQAQSHAPENSEAADRGRVSKDDEQRVHAIQQCLAALRKSMRAASDETAIMEPSESVDLVANAISEAATQIEEARDYASALGRALGVSEGE